ncbi:MAG: hypothetical protein OXN86_14345 [Chloroflexota bacterium]|nr:hypothetical protein [Chloroflexota bacterium]
MIWDGQELALEVDEADTTPLIGMLLLEGHDLHVQVRSGGRLTIEHRS